MKKFNPFDRSNTGIGRRTGVVITKKRNVNSAVNTIDDYFTDSDADETLNVTQDECVNVVESVRVPSPPLKEKLCGNTAALPSLRGPVNPFSFDPSIGRRTGKAVEAFSPLFCSEEEASLTVTPEASVNHGSVVASKNLQIESGDASTDLQLPSAPVTQEGSELKRKSRRSSLKIIDYKTLNRSGHSDNSSRKELEVNSVSNDVAKSDKENEVRCNSHKEFASTASSTDGSLREYSVSRSKKNTEKGENVDISSISGHKKRKSDVNTDFISKEHTNPMDSSHDKGLRRKSCKKTLVSDTYHGISNKGHDSSSKEKENSCAETQIFKKPMDIEPTEMSHFENETVDCATEDSNESSRQTTAESQTTKCSENRAIAQKNNGVAVVNFDGGSTGSVICGDRKASSQFYGVKKRLSYNTARLSSDTNKKLSNHSLRSSLPGTSSTSYNASPEDTFHICSLSEDEEMTMTSKSRKDSDRLNSVNKSKRKVAVIKEINANAAGEDLKESSHRQGGKSHKQKSLHSIDVPESNPKDTSPDLRSLSRKAIPRDTKESSNISSKKEANRSKTKKDDAGDRKLHDKDNDETLEHASKKLNCNTRTTRYTQVENSAKSNSNGDGEVIKDIDIDNTSLSVSTELSIPKESVCDKVFIGNAKTVKTMSRGEKFKGKSQRTRAPESKHIRVTRQRMPKKMLSKSKQTRKNNAQPAKQQSLSITRKTTRSIRLTPKASTDIDNGNDIEDQLNDIAEEMISSNNHEEKDCNYASSNNTNRIEDISQVTTLLCQENIEMNPNEQKKDEFVNLCLKPKSPQKQWKATAKSPQTNLHEDNYSDGHRASRITRKTTRSTKLNSEPSKDNGNVHYDIKEKLNDIDIRKTSINSLEAEEGDDYDVDNSNTTSATSIVTPLLCQEPIEKNPIDPNEQKKDEFVKISLKPKSPQKPLKATAKRPQTSLHEDNYSDGHGTSRITRKITRSTKSKPEVGKDNIEEKLNDIDKSSNISEAEEGHDYNVDHSNTTGAAPLFCNEANEKNPIHPEKQKENIFVKPFLKRKKPEKQVEATAKIPQPRLHEDNYSHGYRKTPQRQSLLLALPMVTPQSGPSFRISQRFGSPTESLLSEQSEVSPQHHEITSPSSQSISPTAPAIDSPSTSPRVSPSESPNWASDSAPDSVPRSCLRGKNTKKRNVKGRRVRISNIIDQLEISLRNDSCNSLYDNSSNSLTSSSSPVHYAETTNSKKIEDEDLMMPNLSEYIIRPDLSGVDPNLRRSQRTRVKALNQDSREKKEIMYRRDSTGMFNVIDGVVPTMGEMKLVAQEKKRRKQMRMRKMQAMRVPSRKPRRKLSTHWKEYEENVTYSTEINVKDSDNKSVTCELVGRTCDQEWQSMTTQGPVSKADSLALTVRLNNHYVQSGEMQFSPFAEKDMSQSESNLILNILQGKFCVHIHHGDSQIDTAIETGDHIFIPKDSSYSVKNLRRDIGRMTFFLV